MKADEYKKNMEQLERIELSVVEISKLFRTGRCELPDYGILTIENTSEVVRVLSSLYSITCVFWGRFRVEAERAETRRKHQESVLYMTVKKELLKVPEAGKRGDGKLTQRDIESAVAEKCTPLIDTEIMYDRLFIKASACKEALDKCLWSIDSITRIRSLELKAASAS